MYINIDSNYSFGMKKFISFSDIKGKPMEILPKEIAQFREFMKKARLEAIKNQKKAENSASNVIITKKR